MRENYLQFIQVTPEQLQQAIIDGVKEQLDELKKNFQLKEPTEFLTRNEVKDMLKVDLTTIWNYTNKGKLKAYGIGNRVYYKRNEVEAALKPLKH
ncbi:helix-turn-helix domain-containing protein [Maribellus mangrovi]|uniref:helix-turn-helix domain-containing protein n=1 Tax=Maribellus mangrovi TaxID=3133146 RepID=UPI0030EC2A59